MICYVLSYQLGTVTTIAGVWMDFKKATDEVAKINSRVEEIKRVSAPGLLETLVKRFEEEIGLPIKPGFDAKAWVNPAVLHQ